KFAQIREALFEITAERQLEAQTAQRAAQVKKLSDDAEKAEIEASIFECKTLFTKTTETIELNIKAEEKFREAANLRNQAAEASMETYAARNKEIKAYPRTFAAKRFLNSVSQSLPD